ncbi:MAG: hypothetical protein A2252_04565 [Elusimicrobia bacterium RIFOXYA2_FULL_39_19]|nr:MAG: hypothetical protein A2252_04565 [Elusimicrobia bacterium RIFOXYA2_FULL_39_19]
MATKKKGKSVTGTQKKKEIKAIKTKAGTKPGAKATAPKKVTGKPANKPRVSGTNTNIEGLQGESKNMATETNADVLPTKQENTQPKGLKPSKTGHIKAMDVILLDGDMHSRDEIVDFVFENSMAVGDDPEAWKKKLKILTYVRYFTLKNKGLNMVKDGDRIGLSKDTGAGADPQEQTIPASAQEPPATTEPADNQ